MKKNLAQPTVASQSPIRAPTRFNAGADARPAPAAALRVHANTLPTPDVREDARAAGGTSAGDVLSVLSAVVIRALYKRWRINTNSVRQIALTDQ